MKKENTQLCPKCKTGQDAYKLDSREPMCPYLFLYNGSSCRKFENMLVEDENCPLRIKRICDII